MRSRTATISVSTGSRGSMRSSPSSTANGSSPTCPSAISTAWPRPERVALPDVVDVGQVGRLRARGSSRSRSPLSRSTCSSSKLRSKWSSRGRLLRPVMNRTSSSPAATASSTTYWMAGLSTTGSISLGVALVAGRNRVPRPAAGMTALRTTEPELMLTTLDDGARWPGVEVGSARTRASVAAGPVRRRRRPTLPGASRTTRSTCCGIGPHGSPRTCPCRASRAPMRSWPGCTPLATTSSSRGSPAGTCCGSTCAPTATSFPARWASASRPARRRTPQHSPRSTSCSFPAWRSAGTAGDWVRAAATTTGPWPSLPRHEAGGPLVAVLLHDDEVLDSVPFEPHDCVVDAAVTPSGVVRFEAHGPR